MTASGDWPYVASEGLFFIARCGVPSDSATVGGAGVTDDYPGMNTSEGNRRPPASSAEWSVARDASGASDRVGRRPSQVPSPVERQKLNAATRGPTVAPHGP